MVGYASCKPADALVCFSSMKLNEDWQLNWQWLQASLHGISSLKNSTSL